MNRLSLILRQKLFTIIFIIVSIFGGVFVFWYLNGLKAGGVQDFAGKDIFTAATDIESGQVIGEELLEMKKIPENIFNEKFIIDKSQILDKKAAGNINKGEIISKDKIEGSQAENVYLRFSAYIPEGLRATSIPVNYYGDVSLIRVGDNVDLISTYYDKSGEQLISEVVIGEKEIIFIQNSDGSSSTTNPDNQAKESKNDFLFGGISGQDSGSSLSNLIVLTFYLLPAEVENIFLALDRGAINISICPKQAQLSKNIGK
ncbi:MAG TPA: Flp pilus assembly protein CpaB [Methanosarcinales archaeon]|nr:Flp pilus assembly protein CpaB [Methanosarcinales archaeon]